MTCSQEAVENERLSEKKNYREILNQSRGSL